MYKLIQGDVMENIKRLKSESADLIITDLPSVSLNKSNKKTTSLNKVLPLNEMWTECKRVIKENGVIVFITTGMYTADLMITNRRWWRYNLVWKSDNKITDFLNASKKPLTNHRDICVFSKSTKSKYNPQMTIGEKNYKGGFMQKKKRTNNCYGELKNTNDEGYDTNEKYPISVLNFSPDKDSKPTEKPLELLEYLIKTYSDKGDFVVDIFAKYGKIGVACVKQDRHYLGLIDDEDHYNIALERLQNIPITKKVTEM